MSGYAEFARLTATPFDRAVDKAINDANDRAIRWMNGEHVDPDPFLVELLSDEQGDESK